MLLALIICQLSVVLANPFHKYPFVFLLDIGNEELQNAKAEQIRLSVPGGSVALRYPAIGDGDTISHVRASSIDFGNDLKVNIVDGGPGYKYVVFVLMGNPGVPYDAVVTIKTLSKSNAIDYNLSDVQNVEDQAQVLEVNDSNDSAEDLSDSAENRPDQSAENQSVVSDENESNNENTIEKSNAEVMESSANVYSYAENEIASDGGDANESGKYTQYEENIDNVDDQNAEAKDYIEDDEVDQDVPVAENPKAEQIRVEEDYNSDDQQEPVRVVDENLYEKYQALKAHLYDGVKVYSQNQVLQEAKPIPATFYENDDPMEFGQTFNDEEVHNDADTYEDNNNNNNLYYDNDSKSAAY